MTSFNVWIIDLYIKQKIIGKDVALKIKLLGKIYDSTKEDGESKKTKQNREIREFKCI